MAHPSMEVCMVARYNAMPIILTETVRLTARRRNVRHAALDAIAEEDDDGGRLRDSASMCSTDDEDAERGHALSYAGKQPVAFGGFYDLHPLEGGLGYTEGEDGELSWFNAGVRVGVGLGLGTCLGLGIGVGLMIRTYQTTARSLRRGLF
eukprot:SM000141S00893  [mRNA]  locus=s141:262725:263464:+ [translate_table: standard]